MGELFDSKFSKNFQKQIRTYIKTIFGILKDIFIHIKPKFIIWILITYTFYKQTHIRMNTKDIMQRFYKKRSSLLKSKFIKSTYNKKLVRKIMN